MALRNRQVYQKAFCTSQFYKSVFRTSDKFINDFNQFLAFDGGK